MTAALFNHKEIKDSYREAEYFDVIGLNIVVKLNNPKDGSTVSYHLKRVEIDNEHYSGDRKFLDEITEEILNLNSEIDIYKNNHKKEWNLFYLYKDIFQILSDDFNYYRGQATDWAMLPGILRDNVDEEFLNNYEATYQDIMYRYPDIIKYVEPIIDSEKIAEREQELAHLQHYGFHSSLIDITENPFIALLFMISNTSSDEFENGIIDAFSIKADANKPNNLFNRVKLLETNKRIIAQKGAFLNFEKVVLNNNQDEIDKIPLVRIKLTYEFPELDDIEDMHSRSKEELEQLTLELGKLRKSGEISSDYMQKILKERDKQKEIEAIDKDREKLEDFYKEYFLDAVRNQISKKLEEFHYIENDLFPDFDKYIDYIKLKYENQNREQLPDLVKGYETQNGKNVFRNLKDLLDDK